MPVNASRRPVRCLLEAFRMPSVPGGEGFAINNIENDVLQNDLMPDAYIAAMHRLS